MAKRIEVDWTKAPKWATAVARDSNGLWYWFECEPRLNGGIFNSHNGAKQLVPMEGPINTYIVDKPKLIVKG